MPNSSLVRISFDSPSPVWAQRIANGVADSYVTTNLERRYAATAYARTFLKERLEELKLKLEESEKALVAYAEQKELISEGGKDGGKQILGGFRFGGPERGSAKGGDRANQCSGALGTGE